MTAFRIYQPTITNSMADDVNRLGWDVVPWGRAYSKVTFLHDEAKAWPAVQRAIQHNNLYRHTYDVSAEDVDGTFGVTNGYAKGDDVIVHQYRHAKSGSVGDVVISDQYNDRKGWVCLGSGWAMLTKQQVCEFQSMVSTTMRMEVNT